MRAVIQRVSYASLKVDGKLISEIKQGFLVFLGVGAGDSIETSEKMAKKIALLRVFEDEKGKINLSLADISGEILLVSQFTLYADCKHGNRPSFTGAEKPEIAQKIYENFINLLKSYGLPVKTGIFGADMKIELLNNGPVTIILDDKDL